MKSVQVREAKATLSALIEAAERGKPTTITKHGKAAAVIVPVDQARRLYPKDQPNFGALLLEFPGGVTFERRTDKMRDLEL